MRRVIVAIDSFKGCLTSAEANHAAAEAIRAAMPDTEVLQIPVSDGGEGWLEAFRAALGGRLVDVRVNDPLMRPIVAQYLVKDDTAVIEMARASGLTLLSNEERNPMVATSYGTGQLVADAVRRGCRHIIVGLGGSATSDCGIGMLRAITDAFAKPESIPAGVPAHGLWEDITALHGVRFTIATDVTNPLCGENGAAHVFAPQKFAVRREPPEPASQELPQDRCVTPEKVLSLDARARRFADVSARHFGYDRRDMPGAGAAGGLGYAFLQYMNAERRSGIDLLLEAIRFDELLRPSAKGGPAHAERDTSLVITGEGRADRQTLMGKLPYGILQRAKAHGVPVVLVAGRVDDRQQLLDAGFSRVIEVSPRDIPLEEAMNPETAKRNIQKRCLSFWSSR